MLFTISVSIACVIAMVSAAKIEGEEKVKSVAIHIRNDKKYHFIEQNEIMDLVIHNRHVDIERTPLSRLDIHSMERVLLDNPWVAGAEVFIDNERVLHIYVNQRVPVARLFQQNNYSYYLDSTMHAMPLSRTTVFYTTVFTNVPDVLEDSAGRCLKKQIVTLSRAIQADSFWNAQVSEVIVDSDGTFELTPVLGNQEIVFGDATNMKEKFSNLFVFYKDVLNRIGWDKYNRLDVRFNGQVVASPSLPYKGPVDKAVVNMNWINTMVEAGEKDEDKDSSDHQETEVKTPVKPIATDTKDSKKSVKTEKYAHAAPLLKAKARPLLISNKEKNRKVMAAKELRKGNKKQKEKDKKPPTPKYVYPDKNKK